MCAYVHIHFVHSNLVYLLYVMFGKLAWFDRISINVYLCVCFIIIERSLCLLQSSPLTDFARYSYWSFVFSFVSFFSLLFFPFLSFPLHHHSFKPANVNLLVVHFSLLSILFSPFFENSSNFFFLLLLNDDDDNDYLED